MNPDFSPKSITLQELQPLLQKTIGDELIVDGFTTESLLPPGENYGSTILSVHAVIRRNSDAEKEDLFLVAKLPLPIQFQMPMFDNSVTFEKEIAMYEDILPCYNKLEIEQGVPKDQVFDILPKYYGSRMSLDPEVKFDDNAAILLENLKNRGYYVGNRKEGHDYAHSKLAMSALARFHALGIAMKYKKPEQFKVFKERSKSIEVNMQAFEPILRTLYDKIKHDEVLGQHADKCGNIILQSPENIQAALKLPPEEPWGTIVHTDFWVNNIMFHSAEDGKVDDIKFIDFQNYMYYNPIREMVFYLFSSVNADVHKNHISDLIDLYHKTLLKTLTKMRCDTGPFNRKSFDEQIPKSAQFEFLHLCFMMKLLTLDPNEMQMDCGIVTNVISYEGNQLYVERLRRFVLYFIEQNWI